MNFPYRMHRGPPPPTLLLFQTKGFAPHVGALVAAWQKHMDVGDTNLGGTQGCR